MSESASILGPNGPFAATVENFSPRPQQQEMATAVEQALESGQPLVVEAGTGTGKTFAYLVPAVLSGEKTIISTGSRNLQDQLFHRDLPRVLDTLGTGNETALLKGRSNYVCLHRLERAGEGLFPPPEEQLQTIRDFAGISRSGDIEEIASIPPDAKIWPQVTSTADNCLGQECGRLSDCFLLENRRRAQEADILVVNHHLFFADLALRDGGFGEVLPYAKTIIFDEAHLLPEVATQFFGFSVSNYQILELARDCRAELQRLGGDMPTLVALVESITGQVHQLQLAIGTQTGRFHWTPFRKQPLVEEALIQLHRSVQKVNQELEEAATRSRDLETCRKRGLQQEEYLFAFLCPPNEAEAQSPQVQWLEIRARGFRLSSSPLETGPLFREHLLSQPKNWIFTSATLSANHSFQHFQQRTGLENSRCLELDTPFDYPNKALLYLPTGLPEPRDHDYLDRLLALAAPVLRASQGRAFFLFTSYQALRYAAARLPEMVDFPLLIQGAKPNRLLLEDFRTTPHGVLLGTSSFWQGVDVQGETLSCVIIDKLPFASPGDPLVRARIEHMRKQGNNPFTDYQVPEAILALKQGVGRLIRDTRDRGVMMICDPRLTGKGYGKAFLDSLPPMKIVRAIDDVEAFFRVTP